MYTMYVIGLDIISLLVRQYALYKKVDNATNTINDNNILPIIVKLTPKLSYY